MEYTYDPLVEGGNPQANQCENTTDAPISTFAGCGNIGHSDNFCPNLDMTEKRRFAQQGMEGQNEVTGKMMKYNVSVQPNDACVFTVKNNVVPMYG